MLQRHKLSSSLLLIHSFTLSYLCALCAPISVISVLPSLLLFRANLALCEPPKCHPDRSPAPFAPRTLCHPDRSSGAFCRCAVEGSWHSHLILSAPFFPANSVSAFTPARSGRHRPSSLFLSTLVHAFIGLSQLSVSSAAPLFSLC